MYGTHLSIGQSFAGMFMRACVRSCMHVVYMRIRAPGKYVRVYIYILRSILIKCSTLVDAAFGVRITAAVLLVHLALKLLA